METLNWNCSCGEADCAECGTAWARQEADPQPVKQLGPGVWLLDDGTYRVDF